jgi:hypothetical protein
MAEVSFIVEIKISAHIQTGRARITVPANIYGSIINNPAIIKVGAFKKEVEVYPNNTEDILEVPNLLAERLGLYEELRTNVLIKNGILELGPVIGSFTDSTSIRIAYEQRAGIKMTNLQKANSESNTILYFFTTGDYYFEEQRILGTYYNYKSQSWEQRLFPVPDVLYDRGGGYLKRQLAETDQIRRVLEGHENVKKFNPLYIFDKWDVYKKLVNFKDVEAYLPFTMRYTGAEDLLYVLDKSSTIYIKDRKGHRGLGVARVIRFQDGSYEFSYFEKELFKVRFSSFTELVKKVEEVFKNKKMLIQTSIDLIKISGGNVDMRATVQRDGKRELAVVACPVRVGKEGSPITSTRSGSEVYRFEDFFTRFMSYSKEQVDQLKTRVDDFLIKCYKRIEEVYGVFGEIGIDFAVDRSGGIWFIECNAKPGKDTVFLSYDEETIKRAFMNPLEYSKWISGFVRN